MQHKSAGKFSQGERLKKLRLTRQCNWSDIAADLKLSEGMVYAVVSGKKSLGDKAEHRLRQLESEAGIILGQDATELGHDSTVHKDRTQGAGESPARVYDDLMGELIRLRERLDDAQRQMTVVDLAARRLRPGPAISSEKSAAAEVLDAVEERAAELRRLHVGGKPK